MLDAQFDEIIDQIDGWDERVKSAIRHDGVIAAGAVRKSSLDPELVRDLTSDVQTRIHDDVDLVKNALRAMENAKVLTQEALSRAQSAVAVVQASAMEVSGVRGDALLQLQGVVTLAEKLLARVDNLTPFLLNAENDAKLAEAVALDWAQVSYQWAEHMPDTIPPNTLAWMGISGEHWSSRWWANRADNAFGRLTDLYLGAHADPPLTNLENGPITVGSIYFDTDVGVPYVWNGANWVAFYQPVRAVTMSLNYLASAGQTAFNLAGLDMNGSSHALASGEAAVPLVNGVRLAPSLGGAVGDYTIAGSVVTFLRPLRAGDLATFDVLIDPAKLAPGAVNVYALIDIDLDPATSNPGYQNGVRTAFQLRPRQVGVVVNVLRSEELMVSLDGVIQNPGVMFTASGTTITFTEAPAADAEVFIVWSKSTGGALLAAGPTIGAWVAGTDTTLSVSAGRTRVTTNGGNPRASRQVSGLTPGKSYKASPVHRPSTTSPSHYRVDDFSANLDTGSYLASYPATSPTWDNTPIDLTFTAPADGTVFIGVVGVSSGVGSYSECDENFTVTELP